MPRIQGTFYFQLTTDGNLIGEYKNQHTPRQRPESALRPDGALADEYRTFVGEYISTWYEPGENPEAVAATLRIDPKSAPADPTTQFELTWTELGSPNVMFRGEAMLNDGLLIGHYYSAS